MAELLQLDAAAALIGKSEVTLRRLVKAGKIPYQKERTPTGFTYMIDPDALRSYYSSRDAAIFASGETVNVRTEAAPQNEPVAPAAHKMANGTVRVAVAGDSGDPREYWQKKAEGYEERYHTEVRAHAQTREDLGVWRGRAEQAQSMIIKLLPAPDGTDTSHGRVVTAEQHTPQASSSKEKGVGETSAATSTGLVVVASVLAVVVIVLVAGIVYLRMGGMV